ncbi:MAG: type IX secretion system sortase PorU [Paludibacter sp.]|nr:type IX secretion system sortase PorU [Paludibacter sp.]MDD4198255.1 type IX secretion system sortase PorU [Paludibacter sp.]MDD4428043.1 type IX secretion system sortase PorU [Paludibacter sp.]
MSNIQKNILFSILILVAFVCQIKAYAGIHSFKTESILKQGKFVKIRIKESGVYRLTYEDLNAMGINPSNVRIFGYGGALLNQSFLKPKIDDLPELAIHMEKGSDGVFNAGDYILFYAQGVNSWSYDPSLKMYTHVLNHYSNYGYYFVTSDAGEGRKITTEDYALPQGASYNEVNEFTDYVVYEKELVSLINSGKEFYGETFAEMLSLNLNFTFHNIVKKNNAVRVKLDVAATSTLASAFQLSLHAQQTQNLSVLPINQNNMYDRARAANMTFSFTPENDLLNFNLTYTMPNKNSKGYLNYLEVNVQRLLIMAGAAMRFQSPDNLGKDTYSKFNLSNAGASLQVWDITDHTNVVRINATVNNGSLSFYGNNKTPKTYLAIDPTLSSAFERPEIVGNVPNQNLHGMLQADMVIISHPNFVQQAQRLAQAHNDMGEITVEAVTTEQVYNEFSSGTPDATAYRWVMKMLYDNAIQSGDASKRPKYLLLFGKGSFDNRRVLRASNESFVFTYQAENSLEETNSYVTDDYYAFLEDSEGTQVPSHTMDIGVGRFPVSTVKEATNVVSKTIGYMNNENRGIWKNQICYLADDEDANMHMKQADSVALMVSRINPSFQITKIYLDAYQQETNASGESYPIAHAQFHNLLRNGLFLLDFTGHANANGWTNEQILSTADVKNLSNTSLPLWVAVTCNFLQFDQPAVSAGEQVLLNPVGGGIGIVSAARPVFASQNYNINKWINYYLFSQENGKYLRIGDVIARAKNTLGSELNKLSYVYMGDPALRLNYPDKYHVVTDKINDTSIQGNDTLRALSVAKIEGYIADKNGNPVNDFNGSLHATVFDKIQTISTLKNNNGKDAFVYKDRQNKLFSGLTEVVDGRFELTFMLPKDIKYNYGTGRINFYASCDSSGYEAQGHFENFLIGGSNPNSPDEEDGPEINMYLNTAEFKSGDKVNETPLLIAHVSDINGINQVGSGFGHDIMLTIDEDPGKSYILNDYYKSAENDFSQGTIRYKLPELRSGKHTLTFRVWDLLNNSSTQAIEFEVVKGLEPQIFSVYNYPNPVRFNTKFVIEHDRPESVLNAQVDIFDLSGRKIWSFQQTTLNEISWDVRDATGKKLPTGIYLYRVSVQSNSKTAYSKINKLFVVE